MTKGRRLPSERQAEQPSERQAEQDDIEIIQEKATLAVVAGLGKLSGLLGEQAVKCMLRRRDEESKKWEFQETFPVEDFSFEYVRDVFGGGEYQIQALDESGDFVKSFTFHIDHRYRGKRWTEQHGSVPVAGGDGPTWIAAALDKMSEAIKVMAERKPDPLPLPPPPPDPLAMITKLAEAAKAMMPPLPPAPAQSGLKEQLALVESIVNVGTKIIDARGEGGEPSSGDVYMGAVSRLAEPIVELVKAKTQQEMLRAAPRRPALPPAQPTGPVPDQPAEGGKVVASNWLMEIQKWMPLIVGRHRKQLNAEDTAYFVMDELSPPTIASLAEFLTRPDAMATLKQVVPAEVGDDAAWFGEFMQAVNDYLAQDDDAEVDEEEAEPSAGADVSAPIRDLDAEAQARLGKLRDKPEQSQEQ